MKLVGAALLRAEDGCRTGLAVTLGHGGFLKWRRAFEQHTTILFLRKDKFENLEGSHLAKMRSYRERRWNRNSGVCRQPFAAPEFSGKFTSAGIPARAEMVRSYDLEFRLARARKLERALRNKGWTRKQLAEETGYDERAIRNILAGEPVRDQTVVDVSQALGIEPETDTKHDRAEVAEDEYGGYSRSTHRQYESFFYSYRRSFTNYGEIFKSIIEIRWDGTDNKFVFFDYYELDKVTGQDARAHTGAVFMSSFTNLLHLQTIYEGSLRLITLTKMREPEGIMRGAIMTQSENIMSFQPTLSPIVLRRIPTYSVGKELSRDMKMITADESDYEFAAVQLGLTERQTIKLAFDNLQIR